MAKDWAISWRGKITHDAGTDFETAETLSDAKDQFQSRYPMREITAIIVAPIINLDAAWASIYDMYEVAKPGEAQHKESAKSKR